MLYSVETRRVRDQQLEVISQLKELQKLTIVGAPGKIYLSVLNKSTNEQLICKYKQVNKYEFNSLGMIYSHSYRWA